MDDKRAVACLSALGQETRLRIVRNLADAGPTGAASGQLAVEMNASASAMSAHLGILAAAGLVGTRREGKSIVYFLMPVTLDDLERTLRVLREEGVQS